MRTLISTLLTLSSLILQPSAHADLKSDLSSLGGNKEVIRKARSLDPKNKVRVVQNRSVNRNWRLEFGVNYAAIAGGDPYVKSDVLGGNIDLHINPRWSVGLRYGSVGNQLSPEGERVFQQAAAARVTQGSYQRPAIDPMKDSTLAVINWYPLYGKINMFDMGVSQFDIYLLAGGGQANLSSGATDTYTAGGGVGFWFSQHFSSRLEARYQTYNDQIYTGERQMDLFLISFSLGLLL